MVVMAGGRLRGRGFDSPIGIFFSLVCNLFFLPISFFPPLFFLHARSAISMLKHFSSVNFLFIFLGRRNGWVAWGRVSGLRVSINLSGRSRGFFYCSKNWKNLFCQDNNGKWV